MFEFHPKVKSSTKTSAIRYETPFQVEHVSKRSMMLSKAFSYIFLKYSFRSGSDPIVISPVFLNLIGGFAFSALVFLHQGPFLYTVGL